jgi:hypothetical protein
MSDHGQRRMHTSTNCGLLLARFARGALLVIVMVMLATGCHTYNAVDIHTDKGLAAVEPGDTVRLSTTSGAQHVFEVTYVSPQRIGGENADYNANQVDELERSEHDTVKSVGLFAGVTVATAAVIIVVSLAAVTLVLGL